MLAASAAVGLVVGSVSFTSFAQTPQPETTKAEGQREDAIRSDEPAPVVIEASKIPDAQKKTRVEKMLGEQRAALSRGTELLQEARSKKDIIQLNCINDKLTQIKGLLKISEGSSVKMYEAMATGTQDVVNHEFTKIVIAHGKTTLLRAESEQCVGETVIVPGETAIQVVIDEDIQQRDPTEPSSPPAGPQQPPVASVSR